MEGNLKWSYFLWHYNIQQNAQILQGLMADFLEECVSLRDSSQMWFQHDGAPERKSLKPCSVLAATFGNNIIGYGGNDEWPPRSPELNPLDYFLWVFLKKNIWKRVNESNRLTKSYVCNTYYATQNTENFPQGCIFALQRKAATSDKHYANRIRNVTLSF